MITVQRLQLSLSGPSRYEVETSVDFPEIGTIDELLEMRWGLASPMVCDPADADLAGLVQAANDDLKLWRPQPPSGTVIGSRDRMSGRIDLELVFEQPSHVAI